MELRNEVGRAVGMELPGTLVFDYPTASAIAGFVLSKQAPPPVKKDEMTAVPRWVEVTLACRVESPHRFKVR